MDDMLPDKFKSNSEWGCLFEGKRWFGMSETPECGSGRVTCIKNWDLCNLGTPARIILMRNMCLMPALLGHP
eukprot:1139731-Pelagomonas_calceolata.AAC.2